MCLVVDCVPSMHTGLDLILTASVRGRERLNKKIFKHSQIKIIYEL